MGESGMEILSTGEKIKRARIYKGITLKELCKDKISISKMSCIENDKIKPERWILDIVAGMLEIDIDYLIQNDELQLDDYLNKIQKMDKGSIDIDELKCYYDYAESKQYYRQAFYLVHFLIITYIEKRDFDSVSDIFCKYYDLYEKNNDLSKVFFEDISTYFFQIEEFNEALMYLNRLYLYLEETKATNSDINYYAKLKVFEAKCYYYLAEMDKVAEIAEYCKPMLKKITDKCLKGQIYAFTVCSNIQDSYEDKTNYNKMKQNLSEYPNNLAYSMQNISLAYFELGDKENALKQIQEAIELMDKKNTEEYVEFLLKAIKNLIRYNEIAKAQEVCLEASNIAIGLNNIRLVEKTYYYKGVLLQKTGQFMQAEMYMNLAIDALMKFGNKKEKYTRYIEMAKMYHNIGETRDALKYFTLAMSLEEKMKN